MNSFDDLLEFVPKTAKHIANWHLDGILSYRMQIERTLNILSDVESKQVLLCDLAQWALSGFLSRNVTQRYYGGMNNIFFKEKVDEAISSNLRSDIIYPEEDEWVEYYTKTATFVLEQYRYKSKVKIEKGDVCLDVGACVGDTSIWMIENGAAEVHSFEIDRNNLRYLNKNLENTGVKEKVKIIELACGRKACELNYVPNPKNMGGGGVNKADPMNLGYSVSVTDIDGYCTKNAVRPSFIKMDIEGAEPDALAGAKQTIRQYRPKFAICVYHAWQHRWEIPLMLADWLEDYDFYLKKSAPFAETVLFGISKINT